MDAKTAVLIFLTVNINLGYCQKGCGRTFSTPSAKIVGGQHVLPGMLPWQAGLMKKHFLLGGVSLHCGGSIVSEEFILTAAHCLQGLSIANFVIVVGEYNLEENDSTEQFIPVTQFIVHENYDASKFRNDIGLARTSRLIAFNSNVQPICLPSPTTLVQGVAIVSGWGRTSEGGALSPILKAAVLPIITDADCLNYYNPQEITYTNICAGLPQGGKDSCQGDSGGPLVQQSADGSFLQCGIVSWGNGCARPLNPGVYTEVAYYTDWILNNIFIYKQQLNFVRYFDRLPYWKS